MLEVLVKFDNEWKAMCKSLGVPNHLIDDIVQDMYLKVYNASQNGSNIMYNETEPNKYYIYITIRNLYFDYTKDKIKNKIIYIDEFEEFNLPDNVVDLDKFHSLERILEKIDNKVDSWKYDYDKNLFYVYYLGTVSMRELSKHTGISLTSIFNSCKRYKRHLKHHLGEDYQDFLNGDYDKIK